jgi:uncharacterized membrane protein YjjP (DUF1212 family)
LCVAFSDSTATGTFHSFALSRYVKHFVYLLLYDVGFFNRFLALSLYTLSDSALHSPRYSNCLIHLIIMLLLPG